MLDAAVAVVIRLLVLSGNLELELTKDQCEWSVLRVGFGLESVKITVTPIQAIASGCYYISNWTNECKCKLCRKKCPPYSLSVIHEENTNGGVCGVHTKLRSMLTGAVSHSSLLSSNKDRKSVV